MVCGEVTRRGGRCNVQRCSLVEFTVCFATLCSSHYRSSTMKQSSLLASLLFLAAALSTSAQPATPFPLETIGGRTYLICYQDTTTNTQDRRFEDNRPEVFRLYIYSAVTQDVRVSRPGGAGLTVRLKAGEMTWFDTKEVAVPLLTTMNSVERNKVLLVNAPEPILIYTYISSTFGTAATLPLPVEAWGTEYVVAAWEGNGVRNVYPRTPRSVDADEIKSAPAKITVLAIYDSTEVLIEPTDSLEGCHGCERVLLMAGDVYGVEGKNDTARRRDIAGTRVTGSKPIGVISGNTRTEIELLDLYTIVGNARKDLVSEWIRPTYLHGTRFVYLPWTEERYNRFDLFPRQPDFVRVYPTRPEETTLTRIGPDDSTNFNGSTRQIRGFFHDRIADSLEGYLYESSGPAQAFQAPNPLTQLDTYYNPSIAGARDYTSGSAMVEMVPRERWTSFAPFRTPVKSGSISLGMKNFLNIVADSAHAPLITIRAGLKGEKVPVEMPWVIPGSSLRWGIVELEANSTYLVEGPDSVRFSGFVYGFEPGSETFQPTARTDTADAQPAEYMEDVAKAYAFPLPSLHDRRRELPQTYLVEKNDLGCGAVLIVVKRRGLVQMYPQSIEVDTGRTSNVEVMFNWSVDSVRFATSGEFRIAVQPVDRNQPMKVALLLQQDHPDAPVQEVVLEYAPPILSFEREGVKVLGASGSFDTTIVLRNDSEVQVDLFRLLLDSNNQGFSILGTEPWSEYLNELSAAELAPGDSITVLLRYESGGRSFATENLGVESGCFTYRIPLRVGVDTTLSVEEERSLPEELDLSTVRVPWLTPASSTASPHPRRSSDDRCRCRQEEGSPSHPSGPTPPHGDPRSSVVAGGE